MKILVTGDFCPLHRLKPLIENLQTEQVFGQMLHHLKSADLSITNLECPLTEEGQPISKTGPALKAPLASADFLRKAGFDLVTLANNHIMDFGAKGLKDTLLTLEMAQINYLGAGKNMTDASGPFGIEKDGIKVAILNFAENEWSTTNGIQPGANPIDLIENFRAIAEAKASSDWVVVIAHGGHEMYRLPSPRMKKLFRFYVDAGANAVINHHPHCTSGYEIYQGSPIFYSIGNFLFDHPDYRHSIWNQGLGIKLNFSEKRIDFELLHFNQCNELPKIALCTSEESDARTQELKELNYIIQSEERLQSVFDGWIGKQTKMYRSYIEPHCNRYFQALQNRGLLPSFWAIRKKHYLLNLIRCEAHRDILLAILENEVSHT